MNCVYYGTSLKIAFRLCTGKTLQLYISSSCIKTNWYPLNKGEEVGGGCHPFRKYSHSVDHFPIYNKKLLLRPLILNFLSVTVQSLLPQVACPFQKRSTNRVWSYKRSEFLAWRLGGPEIPIQIDFFCERMLFCGLGSIRRVLVSMAKDKNIFTIIEWRDNILKCLAKAFLFDSGAQGSTQYLLILKI